MTDLSRDSRSFSVHARHLGAHCARTLDQPSFEAAAVAYVEDLHAVADEDGAISVIVRDLASGRQYCFLIDLKSGETTECP